MNEPKSTDGQSQDEGKRQQKSSPFLSDDGRQFLECLDVMRVFDADLRVENPASDGKHATRITIGYHGLSAVLTLDPMGAKCTGDLLRFSGNPSERTLSVMRGELRNWPEQFAREIFTRISNGALPLMKLRASLNWPAPK